jgi:hypothetical protein
MRGMPTLANAKHEAFCRNVIEGVKRGWGQGEIYLASGYSTTQHAAEVAGSRLLKKAEIRDRIAELQMPAARKAGVTVTSLLDELRAAYEGAMSSEQFSAATSAAMSRAKLAGLLVDQIEIGAAGEFGGCETTADVVAALLSDQSPAEVLATLALLQHEIEAYAANNATLVPATEPARRRPNEADLSLALHRRRR